MLDPLESKQLYNVHGLLSGRQKKTCRSFSITQKKVENSITVLGDLVISINEDGDHLRVDPMSRQQRAEHPEEETQQYNFISRCFSCRIHLKKEADVIYASVKCIGVCVPITSSHLYR